MTDGRKKTFDQPIKNHIKTHNTFQLFQEMIKQLLLTLVYVFQRKIKTDCRKL